MIRRRRTVLLVLLGLALAGAAFSGAAFVSGSSNPTNLFGASPDWVAPTVSSIDRHTSSPSNGSTVQWDVTFNESVTGVDSADFQLANTGLAGTPAITNVTGSGSTYTVTASTGTGNGSLGLNLVDDDSIVDGDSNKLGGTGTGNGNFTGQAYSIDKTPPALSTLQMFDTNGNGKVDQVQATFDDTIASSTDTAPWTLTNVPSGGSLKSVSTSGAVATLALNEGAGAADTSVGSPAFKVALAQSATGIRDATGNQSSFVATTPSDLAAPVAVSLARVGVSPTNTTSDVQWKATFSESVSGVVTGEFQLANTGLGGTPALKTATGPGAVWTITASSGTGGGSLGLNLVDHDAIADTSGNKLGGTGNGNGNLTGEVYTIDRTAPNKTAIEMFDTDHNGKVDQVQVTFDDTLASSTSTTGWTLANVPSGGSLKSLSTSGSVATLALNEGASAASTAVGTFTVKLDGATTDIKDQAGNKTPGFAATAPTDKASPVVVSLNRGTSPTNAASVAWTAIFTEPVSGVGTSDFNLAPSGITGASISSVTGTAPVATWTVNVNTGSGDGTLGLNLVDDDSIVDAGGNKLGGTGTIAPNDGGFTGQAYTIDKTKPTMTKLEMLDANGNGKVDQVKATFNEPLAATTSSTGWSVANSPSGTSTISSFSASGSVATLNLNEGATVSTAVGSMTVTLTAASNTKDPTGNSANSFSGQTPDDKAAPVVVSLARHTTSPTNLTGVQWDLTLSESVTGVDNGDLSLVSGGGVTGASLTSTTGSGSSYTVTANTGSNEGTLGLNLVDDNSIQDSATNSLVGAGTSDGAFTGEVYTIDRTSPTITALALSNDGGPTAGKLEESDTINVTYSEALHVNSVCSAWLTSGDAVDQSLKANNDVVVTLTDGGANNDKVTVTSGTCTFHFGTIDLGSKNYATSGNVTFSGGGGGTKKSSVDWKVASKTLIIALGTPTGTLPASGVASSTATLTPDTSTTDIAGNSLTSPFSTLNVQQF